MFAACRLWLVLSLAVGLCGVVAHPIALQSVAVADALNLYDRGKYPEFFGAIGREASLHRLFPTFEKEANRWVKAADATSRERRTLVAASVALEIAHMLCDEPSDRAGRYLVWASLLMRKDPPATSSATERLWYLASIAGMEELDEPWVLTRGTRSPSPVFDPIARAIGRGGQFAIASARFPDEPRFQLARVASLEWLLGRFQFVPSYLEFARRHAANRVREEPQSDDEEAALFMRDQAVTTLSDFARLPEVKRAYEALDPYQSLRAEIELHVGYLESGAMNWTSALDHLRRVPALTNETYLRYLSQYFIGCTFQNMSDHAAALDAFERAAEIVPNARSAATQLAAELLLSDRAADRDRAYFVLRAAYSDLAPDDPWRLYAHGDARLWPTYMAQLRQALR